MNEIFDPNAQAYQSQMLSAVQQRKVADMLRQRANQMQQPEGRMVGNQFVAPHWLQQLTPAVNQGMAGYFEGKADRAGLSAQDAKLAEEARALGAQRQHADQWRSSLPQAIAAQAQQTAPYMAPGMDGPENIPGTEAITQQAQAAQPVTTEQILKHTLAGLQNPMLKDEAGVYNKAALAEVDREDRQVQAQALKDQQLVLERERLKQAAEIARQRSEDMRLSIDQRAEAAREAIQARLEIARMTKAVAGSGKASADAARKEAADDRALERLGTKAALLSPLVDAAHQVQTLLDDNEGKPIPGVGYTGILPSVMLTKAGNVNKAKVKMFANAMLRNQAGLSQTLSETENAQLEMLANGNYSEAEFRESWPNLMEKVNASVMATRAGYDPAVVSTFEGRGGQIAPIKSKVKKPATPAAAPVPGAPKARLKYNQATGEFE